MHQAVAGVVVRGAADAVERRVAQVDVGVAHADLGAQHGGAVGQLAVAHVAETRQVFGRGAGAVGAVLARFAEVAAVGAHLFRRLLVHIGVAGLDQVLGGAVHEVEVVAGVVEVAVAVRLPAEAQPLHRVEDGVDVFLLFLLRVGVVEAHVAHALVVARQAEVQADALGVAHVQVAVGLGREAGADAGRVGHAGLRLCVLAGVAGRVAPAAAAVGAGGEVVFDDLAQEVAGLGRFLRFFLGSGNTWRAHGPILDLAGPPRRASRARLDYHGRRRRSTPHDDPPTTRTPPPPACRCGRPICRRGAGRPDHRPGRRRTCGRAGRARRACRRRLPAPLRRPGGRGPGQRAALQLHQRARITSAAWWPSAP